MNPATAPPPAPSSPWLAHTMEIRAIAPEVPSVSTYELAFRDTAAAAAYEFRPGQFNMLYLPGAGEIAISASGDPADHSRCLHTIRTVGNVTRTLAALQPGDTLGLRGPFGTSWPLAAATGRDVIIVSGGIGLAPLRPAVYALLAERERFGQLNLLYGARTPDVLLYTREFDDWTARGMNVHTTVDRSAADWSGNVGVVTLLLERLSTFDPANTLLFCCGPEVMMKFAVMTTLSRGLAPENIWVSLERNMQCAVGFCGHCQLGPEFICKDGPVFRYDRVAPWLDIEQL